MLKHFTSSFLRFPVKWANAVTDWLLGLSSDGSIIIQNAATPTPGLPKVSVSKGWLYNTLQAGAGESSEEFHALSSPRAADYASASESPPTVADSWLRGLGTRTKANGGGNTGTSPVGLTFRVITRTQLAAGVNYLYFRTISVNRFGCIVSVGPEEGCAACMDQSMM